MQSGIALRIAVVAACLGLAHPPALAAEEGAQAPPQAAAEHGGAEDGIDVKKLFAAQCAWCHADYGLKPGKGPRLAGTRLTERQVANTIRNGRADAMPSFKKTLTDEQIQAFATYIKGLEVPN
ncbi:c-type cytochrome [Paracraurococcus lichenis]|uniref:Cytochrome c n=1 Tax=Paracraurococcus lichenis TaxID=3064888 RepID=A0ABT9DZN9_9PROT|nr:cytochrome c [Paracraurococcus sp. LOR1-02]MDO9709382.1 cytochrome c [Paracraurococcus sp. LOR1-02]